MNNFDLKTLEIFNAVCQFLSLSKAANSLYLDQSTVSKKIRQLEQELSIKLFNRTSTGVTLTPQGEEIRPQIEKILADIKALNLPKKLQLKDLRLGLMDNIAAYHYVDFLSENIYQFKQVLISNKGIELIDKFNDGQLDALVLNTDLVGQVTGEYYEEVTDQGPFAVLSGQPLEKSEINLDDLAYKKLLIAPSYCPVSQELVQKLPDSVQLEQVGYTNTLLELVANSNFLSILPISMTEKLTRNDQRFNMARVLDLAPRKISLVTRDQEVMNLLKQWLCFNIRDYAKAAKLWLLILSYSISVKNGGE